MRTTCSRKLFLIPLSKAPGSTRIPFLGGKIPLASRGDFIIYHKSISWHISTSKPSHFPTEIKFLQQFPADATSFPPRAPPAMTSALLGTGNSDVFPFNDNLLGLEIARAPQSTSLSSAGGCCGHCNGEKSSRKGKTVPSLRSEELPGFSRCLFKGLSNISWVFAPCLCISSVVHE